MVYFVYKVKFILTYLSVLIPLGIIDAIWLSIMSKSFYLARLSHLFGKTTQILPVIIFYLIYALGLSLLIVTPALQGKFSLLKIFLSGALFGLVAYGTYDLTNQATLKNWPVSVTIADLLWGSIMTGAVSVISLIIIRHFS